MLSIDQIYTLQGVKSRGFFVRNRTGKVLAIGAAATSIDAGWIMPSRKRYVKDASLCDALGRLTALPVKWNLTYDWRTKTLRSC